MAIAFTCPHCGYQRSASEAYAGSSGPCASCGAIVKLPGVQAELASPGKLPVNPDVDRAGGMSPFQASIVVLVAFAFVCVLLGGLTTPSMSPPRRVTDRRECVNNLHAISSALLKFYVMKEGFPRAYITDENGQPMHSWRVLLLPHLDQEALYRQYDFNEPWDGPNNRKLMDRCPDVFRCPPHEGDRNFTRYQVVVAPGTGWKANERMKFPEFTDELLNTIMVIETDGPGTNWLDPTPLTLEEVLPPPRKKSFWAASPPAPHPGGRHAVNFDGRVHFLPDDIEADELRRLLLINDGATGSDEH
ncbi:DUF1559 family PulG-like putative transporter [Lignipirellula cremea]|uniref:DUF1559 domain-containing protein n=1 Tax=Lignipirellula cremea TaxID=2528010 RepID=A0A518DU19_9BACT|nr:DUF1559 domain-containing protein [Lignipirellula cremea]QDU95333.1 hypothetical protein Pla8534_31480 [Lignipirellula cremea]